MNSGIGFEHIALLGVLLTTVFALVKEMPRELRWMAVLVTIGILTVFAIPKFFGGCRTAGVTSCLNPQVEFLAQIGDLIGFSIMLVFPVFFYVICFGVAFAELLRLPIKIYSRLRASGRKS